MRLAPLPLLASLALSPAITLAQGMDVPPDQAAAPVASPPAAAPAPEQPLPPAAVAAPAPAPEAMPPPAAPGQAGPTIPGAPAAPGPATATAMKPLKNGGYVGFSVITGKGTVYLNGQSASIDEALQLVSDITGASGQSPTTLGLMLRLGWGSGDFLFGTQFNWIRSFISINGTEAGYDFRGFDLTATWWSQETGIYARVGVGPAQYRVYAGSSESDPAGGVELMAGFGVTMGALGVGMDLIRQSYDANETGFDAVQYVTVSLSLDLY